MVEIPYGLLHDQYTSLFLSESTLSDLALQKLGPQAMIQRVGHVALDNVVQYSQYQAAGILNKLGMPPEIAPAAKALFGFVADGISAGQDISVGATLVDSLEAFQGFAQMAGVFDDVPIVGWVLGIAVGAAQLGINAWTTKHTKTIEADPFQYSKASDSEFTGVIINHVRSADLTPVFLPWNDASQPLETYNVELASQTEVALKVAIPRGIDQGGQGWIPGMSSNIFGWQYNTHDNPETRSVGLPWSVWKPSTQQGAVVSWNMVLANGRACYRVDGPRLVAAWDSFWSHMMGWSGYSEYSKKTRARIRRFIEPMKYMSYEEQQAVPDAYRELTTVNGSLGKHVTMRGATRYIIERQLMARQAEYLNTMTVAYVSEHDPAFNDPDLADMLVDRRKLFLTNDAAVKAADLKRIVDKDFRTAVAHRQNLLGPGGLKQAEQGKTFGEGKLYLPPEPPKKVVAQLPVETVEAAALEKAGFTSEPSIAGVPAPADVLTPQGVAGEEGLGSVAAAAVAAGVLGLGYYLSTRR